MVVDAESRIYAVDGGNNRIQIFDSAGSLIATYGSAGSGGRAWRQSLLSDYNAGTVEAFSAYGNWLHSYTSAAGIYTGNHLNPHRDSGRWRWSFDRL